MLSPFTAPGHNLFLSPRHASLSLGSASLKLLFYFLPCLLKLPSQYIYIKCRSSSRERWTLTSRYGVRLRGRWVVLLPELLPTTVPTPRKRRPASPWPRLAAATRCSSSPSICSPFPPPAAPLSASPPQGWEALLSRTQAAERKAVGFGREAGLQAPAESKATAEPAASPLSTRRLARCKAQGCFPHLAGVSHPPSLSPRDVPGREGRERSPGCRKNSTCLQKEDVKIIKHR